jgi:hypothetical protein
LYPKIYGLSSRRGRAGSGQRGSANAFRTCRALTSLDRSNRMKKPQDNSEAQDILHDLDKMPAMQGKEWSIELAQKLGLTPEQIKDFMGDQKQ